MGISSHRDPCERVGGAEPRTLIPRTVFRAASQGTMAGIEAAVGHTIVELPRSHISSLDASVPSAWKKRPGIVAGIAFTGLNPFFLLWWATVGSFLVTQVYSMAALGGVTLMYAAHVWVDFAWLGTASKLASRSRFLVGRLYRVILTIFAIAMLYFGATLILSGPL